MNPVTTLKVIIMIAVIDPAAVPALRIAEALFLIINLLAGAWAFGVTGDDSTVRIRRYGDSRQFASYRRSYSVFRGCFLRFVCSLYGVGLWID